MILNLEHTTAQHLTQHPPLLLIHGLFGSIGNLGVIARAFQDDYDVIQVDVRNHGHSAHSDQMNYPAMAQDIVETLDHLGVEQVSVIGHSMGGKIAMAFADLAPTRVKQLVVLDMAPYAYQENHHDEIFKALFAVKDAHPESRKDATALMQQFIKVPMVNQFLLKSFYQGQWRFNVDALYAGYAQILNWRAISPCDVDALFLRGANSAYVAERAQQDALKQQFPQAQLHAIDNTGHWLHAEQPQAVIDEIKAFLD